VKFLKLKLITMQNDLFDFKNKTEYITFTEFYDCRLKKGVTGLGSAGRNYEKIKIDYNSSTIEFHQVTTLNFKEEQIKSITVSL